MEHRLDLFNYPFYGTITKEIIAIKKKPIERKDYKSPFDKIAKIEHTEKKDIPDSRHPIVIWSREKVESNMCNMCGVSGVRTFYNYYSKLSDTMLIICKNCSERERIN